MITRQVSADRIGPEWAGSDGLTTLEVLDARQRYGPNDVVDVPEHPWWALAHGTAKDPMIWSFAATSALYGVVGQTAEATTLLTAIVPLVPLDVFLHQMTQATTDGLTRRLASRASVVPRRVVASSPLRYVMNPGGRDGPSSSWDAKRVRPRKGPQGLAEGPRVILHPGDTLVEGARVRERLPVNSAARGQVRTRWHRCARRQDSWMVTGGLDAGSIYPTTVS